MRKGGRIRLTSAGGGGWGDPSERPQDMIDRDSAEGLG
jgi:N-methylhydantoinase B/oxoprolinase/acetone carboxylase alpha subunit